MAHADEHGHEHLPVNGPGYEVEDASVREVIFTGIGLMIGTIIVCFAVAGLIRVLASTERVERVPMTEVPTIAQFPPSPRLQSKPWEEMQTLRHQEQESLTTYSWVDKNAGKVRIPIDRAMDLVMQRGLPVRTQNAASRGGSGRSKTGASGGNVPPQATGFPAKGAGAKTDAAQK